MLLLPWRQFSRSSLARFDAAISIAAVAVLTARSEGTPQLAAAPVRAAALPLRRPARLHAQGCCPLGHREERPRPRRVAAGGEAAAAAWCLAYSRRTDSPPWPLQEPLLLLAALELCAGCRCGHRLYARVLRHTDSARLSAERHAQAAQARPQLRLLHWRRCVRRTASTPALVPAALAAALRLRRPRRRPPPPPPPPPPAASAALAAALAALAAAALALRPRLRLPPLPRAKRRALADDASRAAAGCLLPMTLGVQSHLFFIISDLVRRLLLACC